MRFTEDPHENRALRMERPVRATPGGGSWVAYEPRWREPESSPQPTMLLQQPATRQTTRATRFLGVANGVTRIQYPTPAHHRDQRSRCWVLLTRSWCSGRIYRHSTGSSAVC